MARRASFKPPTPRMTKFKGYKMPKLKSLITAKTYQLASTRTKLSKGFTQDQLIKALSKIKQFKLPKGRTDTATKGLSSSQLLSRLRTLTKTGMGTGRGIRL